MNTCGFDTPSAIASGYSTTKLGCTKYRIEYRKVARLFCDGAEEAGEHARAEDAEDQSDNAVVRERSLPNNPCALF